MALDFEPNSVNFETTSGSLNLPPSIRLGQGCSDCWTAHQASAAAQVEPQAELEEKLRFVLDLAQVGAHAEQACKWIKKNRFARFEEVGG